MTRISSLLVASTLAILPLSAFAQTAAPAKSAEPTGVTTTAPATPAPAAGKTTTTATTKSDVKAPAQGTKTDMHNMNTDTTHHSKSTVPAKTAEPSKS